jgi:PAS domain S-box-containing protein
MLFSHFTEHRASPPPAVPATLEPLSVLRVAFEGSPHGIIVSAEDGTIQFVNGLASRIFAYELGELLGQPLSRLLPEPTPASDSSWTALWTHVHDSSAIAGRTVAGMRKDGSLVPLEIGLNVLADGPSRYIVASIVDISDRLAVESRVAAATNAHLEFEHLVADIAAQLGAAEPEAVDDAVVDVLRQLGEGLQLDWAMLWQKPTGALVALPTHQWNHPSCGSGPQAVPVSSDASIVATLEAGEACRFASVDELSTGEARDAFRCYEIDSAVIVPLTPTGAGPAALGALMLGTTARPRLWAPAIVERLGLIACVISQTFARKSAHASLQKALDEIRRLRDRLAFDNVELRREVKVLRTSRTVVTESERIQQVLAQVEQVAPTPATVLLLGETGTGKEVMAQAIHEMSPRHARPMIRVSCAAIPTALIESELFGRERGAYTGALSRQIGRFEAAHQSTLFLDEIGDLPAEVQVKLLRVLQERVIERLGSTQPIKVDVRIIAATNRNLEDAVRDKTFREDLFYRLNVFPITVPPLRERTEDIPALVWTFIDEFSRMFGKTIESISKDSLAELQRYPWPGNVRELRNVIERAVIVANGRQLVVPPPRLNDRPMPQTALTLSALEVGHIRTVLESTSWRVRGRGGAAERLGLKPTTLESRMARLGIVRKRAS